MVNLVLNYLCRKACEGFDASLHFSRLPFGLIVHKQENYYSYNNLVIPLYQSFYHIFKINSNSYKFKIIPVNLQESSYVISTLHIKSSLISGLGSFVCSTVYE